MLKKAALLAEDGFPNCLRRVDVRETQKAGDLAVAVPRNKKKQKAFMIS